MRDEQIKNGESLPVIGVYVSLAASAQFDFYYLQCVYSTQYAICGIEMSTRVKRILNN